MNPYRILGVSPDATEEQLRAAWRRRAVTEHPDSGGSHERMTTLSFALEAALSRLTMRDDDSVIDASRQTNRIFSRKTFTEMSSFTVSVLPVECWHALEIVAAECGPAIHSDPPYLIEFFLNDSNLKNSVQSWCRCDLVPEAGSTTVHVSVGNASDEDTPDLEAVRDYLVKALNELDWTTA